MKKKVLLSALCFTLVFALIASSLVARANSKPSVSTMEIDGKTITVTILEDNAEVRTARAEGDGEVSTISFFKTAQKLTVWEDYENKIPKVVDNERTETVIEGSENPYEDQTRLEKKLINSRRCPTNTGYKVYRTTFDSGDVGYEWYLDLTRFSSKHTWETDNTRADLLGFRTQIDNASREWNRARDIIGGSLLGDIAAMLTISAGVPVAAGVAAAVAAVGASASCISPIMAACDYERTAAEHFRRL